MSAFKKHFIIFLVVTVPLWLLWNFAFHADENSGFYTFISCLTFFWACILGLHTIFDLLRDAFRDLFK